MYDVIVAGGGFTGVAAAVTAARAGLKVLLLEKCGFLGGASCHSYVNPFMNFILEQEDKKVMISDGFFREIWDRLQEKNAIRPWNIYNEEILKYIMDEITEEAGVEVLFHAFVSGASCTDGKIESVTVSTKAGMETIEARYFIDATGDADLSHLAGFPYHIGREDGLCQPMTLCFRITNIDLDKFDSKERERIQKLYKEYCTAGKLINPREDILIFNHIAPNTLHFNTTRVVKHCPVNPRDVSKAERLARKQEYEMYMFLKENAKGFENSVLLASAPQIGVRESRMIEGEYVLTVEDVMGCVKFEDGIAACNYDIDIHSPDGSGTSHWYFAKGTYYTIPYRCLIPKNAKNLLTAGRCISSTHEAQASYRIIPVCATLGHAAGVAIAQCASKNIGVKDVDVAELQCELKSQGAFL